MSTDEDYPGNKADEAEITSRIIHATWDIAPYTDGETPRPFLYWKTDTEWACAAALIKRCVIVFMSCFMYVFMSHFLLTNIKWDVNTTTYLLIGAVAQANSFFVPRCVVPFKCYL